MSQADKEDPIPSRGQAGADPYSIHLEKIDVSDPELFARISAGLRSDVVMDDFVGHLERVSGLEDQGREEIITELKTSVEPFRSLYYVNINYVRYLKGLRNFQKSL